MLAHARTLPRALSSLRLLLGLAALTAPSTAHSQTFIADATARTRAWTGTNPPLDATDGGGISSASPTSQNAAVSMLGGGGQAAARALSSSGTGTLRSGADVQLTLGAGGSGDGYAFSRVVYSIGFQFYVASQPFGTRLILDASAIVSGSTTFTVPSSNDVTYAQGGTAVQMGTAFYDTPTGDNLLGIWSDVFSVELRSNGTTREEGTLTAGLAPFEVSLLNGQMVYLSMWSETSAGYTATVADTYVGAPISVQAFSDYTRTLRWGGISGARLLDGTVLTGYTAIGEDGFDYVNAAGTVAVPEPATTLLLAVGAFQLLLFGMRRHGVHAGRTFGSVGALRRLRAALVFGSVAISARAADAQVMSNTATLVN